MSSDVLPKLNLLPRNTEPRFRDMLPHCSNNWLYYVKLITRFDYSLWISWSIILVKLDGWTETKAFGNHSRNMSPLVCTVLLNKNAPNGPSVTKQYRLQYITLFLKHNRAITVAMHNLSSAHHCILIFYLLQVVVTLDISLWISDDRSKVYSVIDFN